MKNKKENKTQHDEDLLKKRDALLILLILQLVLIISMWFMILFVNPPGSC